MTFEDLFYLGMDRTPGQLLDPPPGLSLGLGESGWRRSAEFPLGAPDWIWPRDRIPAGDETVGIVHAYHFLEHLTGEEVVTLLIEIQRVLVKGGILQYSMPYAGTELSFNNLDHKSFWTEENFRVLFHNRYYQPVDFEWRLRQQYQIIAGIAARNLAVLGQLVKF